MKIMAICYSGIGTSFIIEETVKKILKRNGKDAEVGHCALSEIPSTDADLFIMQKIFALNLNIPPHKLLIIENFSDIARIEEKLKPYIDKI